MYLSFFNLNKEPFQITPDPSFLFLSPGHKEALASIIYGVEKKKGFVLIIGAVGVGKTTILRAYLETVQKSKLRTIYLFNANVSYKALLNHIFKELEIVPESDDIGVCVNQLHQALIEEYKQGRNILLLVDEAQNMPVDTLENLRMLSNLETAREKLIQIIFSAQPEFEKTLNLEELQQLKQRIAVRAVISPLTLQQGLTYIRHRLKTASDKEEIIFTNAALKKIVRISRGIPRIINVLCDNCLITAFGYGKKTIGVSVVEEITGDFGLKRPLHQKAGPYVAVAALIAVCAWLVMKGTVISHWRPLPVAAPHTMKIEERLPVPRSPSGKRTSIEAGKDASVVRIAERGDTLAKLIKDVYGRVDARMIRMVKKANPEIEDENLIVEGGRIIFPSLK